MPEVQATKPPVDNGVIKKNVDPFNVYLEEGLKPADPDEGIIITLIGFWIFKSLKPLNVTYGSSYGTSSCPIN